MAIFKPAFNIDAYAEQIARNRPDLVHYARLWAKDSMWGETDEDPENDFIDDIPPIRLLKILEQKYDGGLDQFVKDNI